MKDKIAQGKYLDDFPEVFSAVSGKDAEKLALKAGLTLQQFQALQAYSHNSHPEQISQEIGVKRSNVYGLLCVGIVKVLSLFRHE